VGSNNGNTTNNSNKMPKSYLEKRDQNRDSRLNLKFRPGVNLNDQITAQSYWGVLRRSLLVVALIGVIGSQAIGRHGHGLMVIQLEVLVGRASENFHDKVPSHWQLEVDNLQVD
jgi:hypothetical protein